MDPLPEALLSDKQEIGFTSHGEVESLGKMDMTRGIWTDGEHQSTRLLAEQFSNILTLSRLEIVCVVLEAQTSRHQNSAFTGAIMGFLNQSIEFDKSDTISRHLQASPWLMIAIKSWREWSQCSQDMTIAGDLHYRLIF